jgi:hypothetical protein
MSGKQKKTRHRIIMPNDVPQPSVDNPIPWRTIKHTDDFGATIVSKAGRVVAKFENEYDAVFIEAAVNSFYNLMYINQKLRGAVKKVIEEHVLWLVENHKDPEGDAFVKMALAAIGEDK